MDPNIKALKRRGLLVMGLHHDGNTDLEPKSPIEIDLRPVYVDGSLWLSPA